MMRRGPGGAAQRPHVNPVFSKGPEPFRYDAAAELGFHFMSGGFVSKSQANADNWEKQVKTDLKDIVFDPVDGAKALLLPLLEFSRRYGFKWLTEPLELILEGKIEHILRDDITDAEKAALRVPKYSNANMSSSLDMFCETSNILVEVEKPDEVVPPQQPTPQEKQQQQQPQPQPQKEPTLESELFPDGKFDVVAWCRLFPVLKKNLAWRAIFDSRDAAKFCKTPGPVCFCRMHVLVGILAKYKLHWCCDLAHWFYSLPVSSDNPLSNLFHVQALGRGCKCFKLCTVAQGFSHSPRIAQCIAWGLILFHVKEDEPLFVMDKISKEQPPEFLELHRKDDKTGELKISGACCLWIDNIAVSGDDHNQLSKLISRIRNNAEFLNIKFSDPKDWSEPGAASPKFDIEYIGLVADYDPKRKVRFWRHLDKKYQKLEELKDYLWQVMSVYRKASKQEAPPTHLMLTPRVIQCVVGNAIWDCMIALRPLHYIFDLISLGQSLIATSDKSKVNWDKEVPVTEQQVITLIDAVQAIIQSKHLGYTVTSRPGEDLPPFYVATDASDLFGGITVVDVRGAEFCTHETIQFPAEAFDKDDPWDINLKELWVALVALKRYGSPESLTVLGIDSAVARSWLRREFASGKGRARAIEMLKEMPVGVTFRSAFLYSEDNLSDLCSRDELEKRRHEIPARYAATMQILSGEYFYLHTCCEVPAGVDRKLKIAVADLTSLQLDKAKRGWDRWTHHGINVDNTVVSPTAGEVVVEFDHDRDQSGDESEIPLSDERCEVSSSSPTPLTGQPETAVILFPDSELGVGVGVNFIYYCIQFLASFHASCGSLFSSLEEQIFESRFC
jgi:hypothetical protein